MIRCVDSILADASDEIEIILVDDGSTDKSGEICDYYCKNSKIIRTIHKQNGGLSDARNVGLLSSIGDYVVFVDSDDYVCHSVPIIRKAIKESSNADIIAFDTAYIKNDTQSFHCFFPVVSIMDGESFLAFQLKKKSIKCSSSIFR